MCRLPTRISPCPQNHLLLTTCSQTGMAYYPSKNSPPSTGIEKWSESNLWSLHLRKFFRNIEIIKEKISRFKQIEAIVKIPTKPITCNNKALIPKLWSQLKILKRLIGWTHVFFSPLLSYPKPYSLLLPSMSFLLLLLHA